MDLSTGGFDIEPFKAKEEVISQTVQQIIKDFAMFGMDVEFPMDMEMVYANIFRQLEGHIAELLSRNVQKLMALLYQIDIPEKNIIDSWESHPEYTHAQVITELVIYRELRKVIFRNYYKHYKLPDPPAE
jgi:hypothetical protein